MYNTQQLCTQNYTKFAEHNTSHVFPALPWSCNYRKGRHKNSVVVMQSGNIANVYWIYLQISHCHHHCQTLSNSPWACYPVHPPTVKGYSLKWMHLSMTTSVPATINWAASIISSRAADDHSWGCLVCVPNTQIHKKYKRIHWWCAWGSVDPDAQPK